MSSNSRYQRLLRAAGFIQIASEQLGKTPEGQLDRAMHLARTKAMLTQSKTTLEEIADECSMARGMYASNKSIRDSLIRAGETIRVYLPLLATAMDGLDAAAKDTSDLKPLAVSLESLATNFATISFTPVSARLAMAPSDDTLPPQ